MEDGIEIKEEDINAIEPLYNEEKLDFENIQRNPVLKPIADINRSFINFELLIRRALWEHGKIKESIDNMIEVNPKYSETMIISKVQSMLNYIKQIIHSQNLQKEDMKNTIKEMVKIVKENYALLEEESNEPSIIKKQPLPGTLKEEKPKEESKTFFSDLIDKEIPIPDKSNKEGPLN